MARLSYTKVIATAAAATSAQAGFPASNALGNSLAMPWYSTTLGANDFTVTFPVATFVAYWFLHDVNFAGGMVQRSADGIAFVNVANLASFADELDRRRGGIAIGGANVKALRIQIGAGASTDGLNNWRIGSQWPWASQVTLPIGPGYNYRVTHTVPQVSTELNNGLTAEARTGLDVSRIELPFDRKFDDSLKDLITRPRLAPCLFETESVDYPWEAWPVRIRQRDLEETYYKVHKAQRTITLTEVISATG